MTPEGTTNLRSVLLYAHDTYGLGHLRRNLAIAGRLLQRRPGLQVVLMTGSPVADRFSLPRGLTLVQLPPVVKVGAEDYQPRDLRWDIGLLCRARSAIMADVARRFRPDVFLVDHAPQGMKGELLPVFSALQNASPATRIVLGLRDVLDDPASVRQTWAEQGVHRTLESVYDRILVYGSAELLDVAAAYDLSAGVAAKLTYCGYICRPDERNRWSPRPGAPLVLGTAGGGGDGVETLSATLSASAALGVRSLVVTGPLMSDGDRLRLHAEAAEDPRAKVVEFIPDMGAAMSGASVAVTMGGYNTLCELVARGTPTVVVPRLQPRREQAIRAELFARRGVVSVVTPGSGLPGRLQGALAAALTAGRRTEASGLDLHGLDRVDHALEKEAALGRGCLAGRAVPAAQPALRASA